MSTCTYCEKPLRRHSWLSFIGTAQCNRLWCRLKSGHLLWFYSGYSVHITWPKIEWFKPL